MRPLLSLELVSLHYGAHEVLRNVSFSLYSNKIYALVGPNAAGKTTLLLTLAALLEPTSGRILFEGRPITQCLNVFRAKMALLSSPIAFLTGYTVDEFIYTTARLKGLSRQQARRATDAVLQELRLKVYRHVLMEELSQV